MTSKTRPISPAPAKQPALALLGLSLALIIALWLWPLGTAPQLRLGGFVLLLAFNAALVFLLTRHQQKHTEPDNFGQSTIVPPAKPEDALAAIPDLIWTIDYATRRVTPHNRAHDKHHPNCDEYCQLAGILPARVSRQFLESLIELQNNQKPLRFEYSLGNEGEQITYEARLSPLTPRSCLVIIRDISSIKATEAALFKQQIFTQQIIDSSPNLIFVRDRHGRFLLVNQTTQKTLGHELIVQSHTGLHDDKPILTAGDNEAMEHGQTVRMEDSCILPDGHLHWFDLTKLPIEREGQSYVLTIAMDITHLKEQETYGTDFLKALVDALPQGFLLVDHEQILFANHAACDRLQLSPQALIGEPLSLICDAQALVEPNQRIHIRTRNGETLDCTRYSVVSHGKTTSHVIALQ